MKKILILTAIVVALVLVSCDDSLLKYDITIVNNCGVPLSVNITKSKNEPSPSSFVPVDIGKNHTFSNLEDGDYYVHIIDTNTGNYFVTNGSINVNVSETWVISKNGGTYEIEYYRTYTYITTP